MSFFYIECYSLWNRIYSYFLGKHTVTFRLVLKPDHERIVLTLPDTVVAEAFDADERFRSGQFTLTDTFGFTIGKDLKLSQCLSILDDRTIVLWPRMDTGSPPHLQMTTLQSDSNDGKFLNCSYIDCSHSNLPAENPPNRAALLIYKQIRRANEKFLFLDLSFGNLSGRQLFLILEGIKKKDGSILSSIRYLDVSMNRISCVEDLQAAVGLCTGVQYVNIWMNPVSASGSLLWGDSNWWTFNHMKYIICSYGWSLGDGWRHMCRHEWNLSEKQLDEYSSSMHDFHYMKQNLIYIPEDISEGYIRSLLNGGETDCLVQKAKKYLSQEGSLDLFTHDYSKGVTLLLWSSVMNHHPAAKQLLQEELKAGGSLHLHRYAQRIRDLMQQVPGYQKL